MGAALSVVAVVVAVEEGTHHMDAGVRVLHACEDASAGAWAYDVHKDNQTHQLAAAVAVEVHILCSH